ncbi:Hypothetical predicted protein [Olea europaea subsp. europaea]|uniref:Uncharacterized protein n=1 Tax=Olea europaea subsp. europaea TaxID=158383 RepID=A0A8S0TT43_OLEEU|nr:Hypothetical predicted protein [Olea europaea subsp. europaea]
MHQHPRHQSQSSTNLGHKSPPRNRRLHYPHRNHHTIACTVPTPHKCCLHKNDHHFTIVACTTPSQPPPTTTKTTQTHHQHHPLLQAKFNKTQKLPNPAPQNHHHAKHQHCQLPQLAFTPAINTNHQLSPPPPPQLPISHHNKFNRKITNKTTTTPYLLHPDLQRQPLPYRWSFMSALSRWTDDGEKGEERVKRPTPTCLHLTPPPHLIFFAPICSAITCPSMELHVGAGDVREHGEEEERVKRQTPTFIHLTPPPHLIFSAPFRSAVACPLSKLYVDWQHQTAW